MGKSRWPLRNFEQYCCNVARTPGSFLHGTELRNIGHKASTYKQILIPKDGVPLPRMDSCSSVLLVIADPFIIRGCNYYRLRRSILTIEAEAGDSRALELYPATPPLLFQALQARKRVFFCVNRTETAAYGILSWF